MTKPCVTCLWCDWPEFATGNQVAIEVTAACFHPRVKATTSLVNGETGNGRPCWLARGMTGSTADAVCGPAGDLWEGKPGKAVTP